MTSNEIKSENASSRSNKSGLTLLALSLLTLVNLLCYARTLKGYFLADDYVHVAYLSDVLNGHPLKLLENFTGNWMHAWGTQFYRPFITLTLALDYLSGKGSAFTFHLSNTIFHLGSAILLFLVARRLLSNFTDRQQYICALAAAMFFSVSPLHTEVVSWIIGRVDGVCLAFFLAAFYFFLAQREKASRLYLVFSLTCFAVSLLSKEMALILPPLVVVTAFTLGNQGSLPERIKNSLKQSAPFFAVLLVYLAIRTLALGTPTGGYGGSVGEGLTGSALTRFASIIKFLFPFNNEVISPYDRLCGHLTTLYRLCAGFLALRFLSMGVSRKLLKMLALALIWFVLALAPTYQVFNITDSLMCSRFAYFATAPYSILLALLLLPLWESPQPDRLKLSLWLGRISLALSLAFVVLFAAITVKNNTAWAHAGDHVRKFRQALANAASKLPPEGKLVLLNIPQRLEGAHMLYNGAMLQVLASSPLSRPPFADRLLSFEPPTYGDSELINAGRLRRLISKNPQYHYSYWDMSAKRLIDLDLQALPCNLTFDLKRLAGQLTAGSSFSSLALLSPALDLKPLSCDFIVVQARFAETKAKPARLTLMWRSANFPSFLPSAAISLPAQLDGKEHAYFFPVSEHKSWLAGGVIEQLRLELAPSSGAEHLSFESVQILSAQTLMPLLAERPGQLAEGQDGIDRLAGSTFEVSCDCRQIPGCKRMALELSRPNSWFEHYANTFRERQYSRASLKRFVLEGNTGCFQFKASDFPEKAYYELRAFALDENGNVIGFSSDPINLQID